MNSKGEQCPSCGTWLTWRNYYRYERNKNRRYLGNCNLCYKKNKEIAKAIKEAKSKPKLYLDRYPIIAEDKGLKIIDWRCGNSMVYITGIKKKDMLDSGIPLHVIKTKKVGPWKWLHKIRIHDLTNLGVSNEVITQVLKVKFK